MKKLIIFLLAAAFMASCSKDDKDPAFDVQWPNSSFFELGTTATYEVFRVGYNNLTITHPTGWVVKQEGGKLTVKAPDSEADAETSGKITISGKEEGFTFSTSMTVHSGVIATFEDVPANILAVDAKGSNFESKYTGQQYLSYTDEKTGLNFGLNSWDGVEYEFSAGGAIFSTFNQDLSTNSPDNQCTVNYKDPTTGNGGHSGSKVFGIIYGGNDIYAEYGEPTVIALPEAEEYIFDHFWVTNTVYAYLAMKSGNSYTEPLTYEKESFLSIEVTGYNAKGEKTSTVEFFLGDFRKSSSPGLLDKWTKIDLSPLGKINKMEFNFKGSEVDRDYGLNTPTYFAFDDIAIRR